MMVRSGEMRVVLLRNLLVILTKWRHLVRMKLLSKQKGIPAKKIRTRRPHHVTKANNSLDLDSGAFSLNDPRVIARSLRRSSERSRRRKSDPFRSAMSMLNFYIDRAGHKLAKAQRGGLHAAMAKLRFLCHRKPNG